MTRWIGLLLLTAGATVGGDMLHIPSAALFCGLLVAAILAVAGLAPHVSDDRPAIPRTIGLLAQGVLGTHIGTTVRPDTLAGLGSHWLPVLTISTITLMLSIIGGALLGMHRRVDALTGSLSLVAGGASGLVALTRELGGEEKMVAVIQYLRVALVTVTIPIMATSVFGAHTNTAADQASHGNPWWGLVLVATCIGVGLPLARLAHIPAAGLLGPLVLSVAGELLNISPTAAVPGMLVNAAYAIIGWQAGLGFTRRSLASIGRVLPYAIFLIVVIGIGCAGLGVLLSWWTGESQFDSYLATTPGGIYAVLAAAATSGGNITFVIAAQVVRMLLMLFIAPLAARLYQRLRQREKTIKTASSAQPTHQ